MRYLLDTNTCIGAMRHQANIVNHMSAVAPGDCAISTITGEFQRVPGLTLENWQEASR